MNVLYQDQLEEEEGETSNFGVGPIDVKQDRETYITPNIEVHSGVFVDELLGDTIVEVASLISSKKMRMQEWTTPLCTPFTSEQPKLKKNEVIYNPT